MKLPSYDIRGKGVTPNFIPPLKGAVAPAGSWCAQAASQLGRPCTSLLPLRPVPKHSRSTVLEHSSLPRPKMVLLKKLLPISLDVEGLSSEWRLE